MSIVQKALGILESKFGAFDNVKLMLNTREAKSQESIANDLLQIAEGVESGAFEIDTSYDEPELKSSKISL